VSNYLRNRPFMVVTYTYVLAAGQKSNTPGFGMNAEWEPIENMAIVDRVSSKMEQQAELILDLFENKVVKARNIDTEAEKTKLFNVFVHRHFDEVKAALATWIAKDPENLGKVQAFVDGHKARQEALSNDEG
jgi:hypothetical protein